MARLIKNDRSMILGIKIATIFEDGSSKERVFKIGDIIDGLRYVEDGSIITVSGKITNINYTMPAKLTWNKNNPSDTLSVDMTINSIELDASSLYEANVVTVDAHEIVEWEGEEDVKRMLITPQVTYQMEMHYSNRTTQIAEIGVGDVFDKVRIMNPNDLGNDKTGKFTVIGFAYKLGTNKTVVITGIAFVDNDGNKFVADLEYILALNELYSFDVTDTTAFATVMTKVADGDTVILSDTIDTTNGTLILFNGKKDVVLNMGENDIITENSGSTGVKITNGDVIIEGEGRFVSTTPYDKDHASGVLNVNTGGKVIFNGSGVSAVYKEDPVNKGNFGIVCLADSQVIVNDGTFDAGWYAISSSGIYTDPNNYVEINGGVLTSMVDYAIYHPQAGTLKINGGTIRGAGGAICVNRGDLIITGGYLSSDGTGNLGEWSDGTSGAGMAVINLQAKYGDVTCEITGGTFKAAEGVPVFTVNTSKFNVLLSISGGRFSTAPAAEYIADGYECSNEPDEEGFYVVSVKTSTEDE